jgi:TonB family protein
MARIHRRSGRSGATAVAILVGSCLLVIGVGCSSADSIRHKEPRVSGGEECIAVQVSPVPDDSVEVPLSWTAGQLAMVGKRIRDRWLKEGGKSVPRPIRVTFRIEKEGNVVGTEVLRSSGVPELDHRAERTIFLVSPLGKPHSGWSICEKCSWGLVAVFDRCGK